MPVSVCDLVVTSCGLMIWNDAANQTVSKKTGKHWCIAFMLIKLLADTTELKNLIQAIKAIRS